MIDNLTCIGTAVVWLDVATVVCLGVCVSVCECVWACGVNGLWLCGHMV